MNKLFTRVSTEEDDTYVSGQDTSIDEIISRQEDEDEFNEIASELEDDIEAVEEADELVDGLEEVVTGCEALLDNPSQVTAAHVLVAQETLRMTGLMLGTELEDTISLETATESPVTALELSVEGIKDFISKVIAQIKSIFKKIALTAKKLFVKATQILIDTEKQAKKLIENIKDLKDKPDAKFDDKQNKSFRATYGSIAILNGSGNTGTLDTKSIIKYIDAVNDIKYMKNVIKFSKSIEQAYTQGTKTSGGSIIASMLHAAINVFFKDTQYTTISNDAVKNSAKIDFFAPVRFGEKIVTGLGVSYNGKKPEDKAEFMKAVTFFKHSHPIATTGVSLIKVLSVQEIKTILGSVASKTNKDFGKTINEILTTNDAAIEAFEKAYKELPDKTSESKAVFVKFVSFARTTVSSYALDAILGQVSGSRRVIGFCNACVKAHR